ncbi:MAG: PAS domain S-box protein [Spirochaetales bacterium]|nr:PAS domain S-box protein [Spirochaetales bacterium]
MINKTAPLDRILFSFMFHNENGIIVSDEDGNILWANPESCRIYGYTTDEMSDLSIGFFGLSLNTVAISDFSKRDGQKVTVRHSAQTTYCDETPSYLITLIDITAVKPLAISRKQENINTPVKTDSAAVNAWSIDSNFNYTFFNENHKAAMKEIWEAEISLGSHILDYIGDSSYKKQVEANYIKMLRGKSHRSVDHFTNQSGEEKYFENFGHPIRNIKDEITGIMFYTIDVTGKTEIEKRLNLTVSLLESIVNSPEDIHIHSVDNEYRYMFFNNAHKNSMENTWQTTPELGRNIFELLPDPEHRKRVKLLYDRSLKGEILTDVSEIIDIHGNKKYYSSISAPIKGPEGEIAGITIFILNITERMSAEQKTRKSLEEKEILLKEIHHRVTNNIQMISSMINLQMDNVEDKNARHILEDSLSRINTMGLIHKTLYQGDDLSKINMAEYCGNLLDSILEFYHPDGKKIKINSQFDDIQLDIHQAIPVGLIVNELVTNSMKYAFTVGDSGVLSLSMTAGQNGKIHLQVKDNGPGIPENLSSAGSNSLGLKLLNIFTSQLGGTIEFTSDSGLTVDIFFQPS